MVQSNIIEGINFFSESDVLEPHDIVWFVNPENEKDYLVGIVEARNVFEFNGKYHYSIRAPMPEGLFLYIVLTIEFLGDSIKFKSIKDKIYA